MVRAVLDHCLRGLVAAGRGRLICGLLVWPCSVWCSGKGWSVFAASDVNSSLPSQLHRPRGSFWVARLVPAISGPQSRLLCLPRGHVERRGHRHRGLSVAWRLWLCLPHSSAEYFRGLERSIL